MNRIACKVIEWKDKKLTLEACDDLKFDNLAAAAAYFGAPAEPVKEKTEEKKEEEADATKKAEEEGKANDS